MKIRLFAITAILLFSCVPGNAQAVRGEDKALQTLVKQMVDSQLAYDAAALDKIFTADYIEISPVGEFDPREKVLGFYRPENKPDSSKVSATVDITEPSIRSYDQFAVAIVRLNFSMTSEGKPLPPRGLRATLVFRREKGAWKIASAQYTGIRPPQTQPVRTQ